MKLWLLGFSEKNKVINEMNLKNLYSKEYFETRQGNDTKRVKSFELEKKFVEKNTSLDGVCLDIGCSTGEFLENIQWRGKKLGTEVSEFAIKEATRSGIKIIDNIRDLGEVDTAIYRGTIQHLDSPFQNIAEVVEVIGAEGKILFIATPNANSLYYRLFQNLPALDPTRNFYIPSSQSIKQLMKIHGFECVDEEYPYWHSPYANPIVDFTKFVLKFIFFLVGIKTPSIEFPFMGNMMNLSFARLKNRDLQK